MYNNYHNQTTYRLVKNNWLAKYFSLICKLRPQCIVDQRHRNRSPMAARFASSSEQKVGQLLVTSWFFKQCITKQLLNSVFVISK